MAARSALVRPDDMAARVIDGLLDLHPGLALDEVIFGCANQAGEDNRNVARMAVLLSRLYRNPPALTLNRLCALASTPSSPAPAPSATARPTIIIAGGVKSMSRAPFVIAKARPPSRVLRKSSTLPSAGALSTPGSPKPTAPIPSPETAENLAAEHKIARADQDAYALRSPVPLRCRVARRRHPARHHPRAKPTP